jgi:tRNA(adenine34) deaminase
MDKPSDKDWMQKAYEQAELAESAGEVPVGAVLVSQDNTLLAAAGNRVESSHDPSAHAEMLVIRQAAEALNNHRLVGSTLFVTLEPCAMCAGLLVQARIARLVFATRDFKAGAAGSVYNLLQGCPLNHKVLIDEGIMEAPCSVLLSNFFKSKRC